MAIVLLYYSTCNAVAGAVRLSFSTFGFLRLPAEPRPQYGPKYVSCMLYAQTLRLSHEDAFVFSFAHVAV